MKPHMSYPSVRWSHRWAFFLCSETEDELSLYVVKLLMSYSIILCSKTRVAGADCFWPASTSTVNNVIFTGPYSYLNFYCILIFKLGVGVRVGRVGVWERGRRGVVGGRGQCVVGGRWVRGGWLQGGGRGQRGGGWERVGERVGVGAGAGIRPEPEKYKMGGSSKPE